MGEPVVKLGTRGSPLALAQAYETKKRLAEAFPDELGDESAVEIKVIKTTGDLVLNKALAEMGGKGLFTKELDVQLLNEEVDICVHSMKDVPTWLVPGTILPCNLPREDTRDAWISPNAARPSDLADGSVVGTASLRRQAQLLAKCAPRGLAPLLSRSTRRLDPIPRSLPPSLPPPPPPPPSSLSSSHPVAHANPSTSPSAGCRNPTLKCVNFRGNVQTRLKKLDEGVVDATLLAKAGLNRMDMTQHITNVLEWDEMLPAVAQGAIGIQCREGDERIMRFLDALTDKPTKIAVDCERAFLAALDGNCRTPIAGQAKIVDGQVFFQGLIAKPDGSLIFETTKTAAPEDAVKMGTEAGEELKAKCGARFEEFFTEMEVAPEPVSSMSGKTTDGLGGYKD